MNYVRRVLWAHYLHSQSHTEDPGRAMFGGPQPGSGNTKNRSIGSAIVEHFEGRTKEILDAMAAPLGPGNDVMDRHKAAMNIAKHAREEAKEAREADQYDRMTDDEVRREFAAMLAKAVRDGEISIEQIIEGSAVEITDQAQIAS